MDGGTLTLDVAALRRYEELQALALQDLADRFYARHAESYEQFGAQGRAVCRDDLAFHVEFLRAVLAFGLAQPMVDYLRWLEALLAERSVGGTPVVESLDWLSDFFSARMPGKEGRIITDALAAVRSGYLASAAAAPPMPPQAPEPWPEAAAFGAAILAGSQGDALAIVQDCLGAGRSLVDVELHVIQPALYRVGELWLANEVSVAQEHMATAIVNAVMTAVLSCHPAPARNGRRVLLACVQDNQHAVGLRMVADAFQMNGWAVQYLGADVPTPDLVRQVKDWRPDLVGLSVSFAHQLCTVKSVIAALGAELGSARPPVIVGGLAINRLQPLGGMVGADAQGDDALAAVVQGSRLLARDAAG